MSKIEKICPNCGKTYTAYAYEKLFCSGKCYYQSRKGKAWGGALDKGKKRGAYNSDRVEKMAIGKKEAHLKRGLQHPEILRLDEARELLEKGYSTCPSQLCRALGLNKIKSRHKYFADVYYVVFEKEHYKQCTKDIPCSIASLNVQQLRWFLSALKASESWDDYKSRYKQVRDELHLAQRLILPKTIIKFVQETNFQTKVLKKDLTVNTLEKGYSTEKIFRKILQDLKLSFTEQDTLKDTESGKKYRPDFIIDNRLIIEINGDYWHGWNKKLNEMDDRIKARVIKDEIKYSFYRKNNFKYLIIWEHELADTETIIKVIKETLKDAINFRTII